MLIQFVVWPEDKNKSDFSKLPFLCTIAQNLDPFT